MSVDELVEKLADGTLSADEFTTQLDEEAAAAAAAAAETERAERDLVAATEDSGALAPERMEVSPEAQRELNESLERIKRAADKARHI